MEEEFEVVCLSEVTGESCKDARKGGGRFFKAGQKAEQCVRNYLVGG
jgi:hypothetical protein